MEDIPRAGDHRGLVHHWTSWRWIQHLLVVERSLLKYVCVWMLCFCLYCDAWSCRCSCMGNMSVSSGRCCMFVSYVHPVAVLNATFCMICIFLNAGRGCKRRPYGPHYSTFTPQTYHHPVHRFRSWPTQTTSQSHPHTQVRVQPRNTYNHTYIKFLPGQNKTTYY